MQKSVDEGQEGGRGLVGWMVSTLTEWKWQRYQYKRIEKEFKGYYTVNDDNERCV